MTDSSKDESKLPAFETFRQDRSAAESVTLYAKLAGALPIVLYPK